MAEILLQTKLFAPPLRPLSIPRPHLIHKLNKGINGKLTLVSAPAGFGKTTLVSSWLRQCERPFTWLSLDKDDNEPNRFLTYLLAALQKIEAEVGQTAVSLLQSAQAPPAETILALFINDLASLSQPLILVLDDYHTIHSLDIHRALTFLLDNAPPQLHLAITSREDPPLPLHRLRSRGLMNGVYAHELRFASAEAAEFLQQTMNVHLAAEDVAQLARRTEGWIAGLQLAALSLQGLPDAHEFVAGFAGDDRYIADYLLHEVIERQPADIQAFLLKTAVLDRFCPSLCDAVLETAVNHAQTILTHLDDANLFIIPLDNKRQWFRYHHLFADFLRLRAHHELAAQIPILHQRAALWYEENGLLAEAIENALSGNNYEQASRLIEQNSMATIFGLAQWKTLLNWMKALPPEMVQKRPLLSLHFAWALFSTGQWPATEPYLRDVELAVGSSQEAEDQQWMLGEAAALRALVANAMGDWARSIEMAALAHQLLPQANKTIRSVATLAEGMSHMWGGANLQTKQQYLQRALAIAREAGNVTVGLFALSCQTMLAVRAGRIQQAADLYRQAKALGTVTEKIVLGPVGFAYVQMGEVLREWNRLTEAEEILWEGIKLCQQQSGLPVWVIEGHVTLARTKLATGDEPQADKLIQQAEAYLAELRRQGETVERLLAATQAYRLWYWLAKGELEKADRWLTRNKIAFDSTLSPQNMPFHLLLTQLLIKQGQLAQASGHLQRLAAIMPECESLRLSVQFSLLQALCLQAEGKHEQAVQALSPALRLAEPEGFVRLFVDEGEPMARLLQTAVQQNITPTYTQRLLSAFDQLPAPLPPDLSAMLIEPLNDSEQQILRLMAAGLSNRDIADEMFLSVNTIKVYNTRIYGKLGANNRVEAINQARQLGLL